MLKNQCAVATVDPWTFKINRILSGSKVMLYANRTGIIAIGIATAEKRNDTIHEEKARLVKLREFHKLQEAVRAEEISKLAETASYPLRQTVRRLPDELGDKLWNVCLKHI